MERICNTSNGVKKHGGAAILAGAHRDALLLYATTYTWSDVNHPKGSHTGLRPLVTSSCSGHVCPWSLLSRTCRLMRGEGSYMCSSSPGCCIVRSCQCHTLCDDEMQPSTRPSPRHTVKTSWEMDDKAKDTSQSNHGIKVRHGGVRVTYCKVAVGQLSVSRRLRHNVSEERKVTGDAAGGRQRDMLPILKQHK